MFRDNLWGTVWIGEVISTDDKLKLGRVKVKIFGKFDELEDEVIPWSIPYNQLSTGTVIIPKVGDIVNVFFENGDENIPFYFSTIKTSDEAVAELEGDYPKVWSIVYDKRMGEDGEGNAGTERTLEIFYTETQGLIIRKNETFIQLKNEDESILLKNGKTQRVINISDSGISLGTEGVSKEPAVMGQTLDNLLADFITKLGSVTVNSPAGPCSPLNASPGWLGVIAGKFDTPNNGWEDIKSLLVSIDKDK